MIYQEFEAQILRHSPRSMPTMIIDAINRVIRDMNLKIGGFYTTDLSVTFQPPSAPILFYNCQWSANINQLTLPSTFNEVRRILYKTADESYELKNIPFVKFQADTDDVPMYHFNGSRVYILSNYIKNRAGTLYIEGTKYAETLDIDVVYDTEFYFPIAWEDILFEGTLARLLTGTDQGTLHQNEYNQKLMILARSEVVSAPTPTFEKTYDYRTMRGK